MKKYLLLALLAAGCKDETRYFYYGYDMSNEYHRSVGNGTFTTKEMPSYDSLKEELYKRFSCQGFTKDQVIVTSIYEFKDSNEYKTFKTKSPNWSMEDTCK